VKLCPNKALQHAHDIDYPEGFLALVTVLEAILVKKWPELVIRGIRGKNSGTNIWEIQNRTGHFLAQIHPSN